MLLSTHIILKNKDDLPAIVQKLEKTLNSEKKEQMSAADI